MAAALDGSQALLVKINVAVSIGGMVVNPGDIAVGDGDGVVAFFTEVGPAQLEATRGQREKKPRSSPPLQQDARPSPAMSNMRLR